MSNLFYLLFQCLELLSFSRVYPILIHVPHLCKPPAIPINFLRMGQYINLGQCHCIQHGAAYVDTALDRENGLAYIIISLISLLYLYFKLSTEDR